MTRGLGDVAALVHEHHQHAERACRQQHDQEGQAAIASRQRSEAGEEWHCKDE